MKLIPLYSIWRYHRLVFIGTFSECKKWLSNHDIERGDEYKYATRCLSKFYHRSSLDWILCCTEYASISETEPCDWVGMSSFDKSRPINQEQLPTGMIKFYM